MKKIATLIALTLCLGFLPSCNDELDTEQHGATSTENFYKTDDECMEGMAEIYHTIEMEFLQDIMVSNCLSDDAYAGGGARGNDVSLEEINEFRHTAANSSVETLFQRYYNVVYRCNLITSNIDLTTATSLQRRCVAEAKVIRAFYYLRLASYFGEVPLITEEITDGNYARPLASLAEIYAQIEADLSEAIASGDLLEKASVDDKVVNATKHFAQALLGKAYVYESTFLGTDRWSEARNALGTVIGSGKYALYTGEYDDMFHMVGAFSCESLFETNRVFDPLSTSYIRNHVRLGWRTEKFNQRQYMATQAAGLTNCSQESYGFLNPSKELYDAFVEMEGEDGYRLTHTIMTYKRLNAMPLQINNGNNVYGNAGYFQLKVMPRGTERIDRNNYATNFVLLRYAEVLLLAAEAELPIHGGQQAKADDYINQVKQRAQLKNIGSGYTLEDLQKEKRLELCYEGTRYPDAVRWGIASQVMANKGKQTPSLYGMYDGSDNDNKTYSNSDDYNVSWYDTGGTGFQAKHKFLPIPQSELDVNQYVEQHEGW